MRFSLFSKELNSNAKLDFFVACTSLPNYPVTDEHSLNKCTIFTQLVIYPLDERKLSQTLINSDWMEDYLITNSSHSDKGQRSEDYKRRARIVKTKSNLLVEKIMALIFWNL